MYREECDPVRRGRKLRTAVAGWRSRRSRPSVTPNPSRSARGRPASIGKEPGLWPGFHRRSPTATPVMAPLSRPSRLHGPPMQSIPHRRPIRIIRIMSTANALTGADRTRTHASGTYSRTCGRPGFHRAFFLGGRSRGMDGSASRGTGFRRAFVSHTGSAIAAGLVPCALPAASARGPTSAVHRRCTAPLDALGEMCFGLFVGDVGPGRFQGLLHLRPEPAVVARRVRARCRCLSV